MLLKILGFSGEVPRLPAHLLPENAAQYALNCDFQHGELRGLRDNSTVDTIPPFNGQEIVSIYTEDGSSFFGWPWEVDAVKSQVVGDVFYRLFYTGLPDAPIIKQARTHRNDAGVLTPVIGPTGLAGGNYRPPEATNVGFGGNNLGPDSWVLGIPAPKAQNVDATDKLTAMLNEKRAWPGVPNMKLRVTFIVEDLTGKLVYQQDVSNAESAYVPANPSNVFPQVAYTNDSSLRGHKVQDMLWPLMGFQTPAPFKFYFMEPPALEDLPIGRTVDLTNTTSGDITVSYATSSAAVDANVSREQA